MADGKTQALRTVGRAAAGADREADALERIAGALERISPPPPVVCRLRVSETRSAGTPSANITM